MTFLSPAWLLLAAALSGLVLWLHARRRRRHEVSSVRLWQLIESASARRPQLHWPQVTPSLLLQLAVVLLLGFALAQPRLGDLRSPPDHTVFIVDVSSSMRVADVAPSRFAAALAELEGRLETLVHETGGRVSLIAAGAQAELVFARQERLAAVLPALHALTPTDGTTDWAAAFSWLPALIRDGETTDVIVLTDGEDPAAVAWVEDQADARFEAVVFGQAREHVALTAHMAETTPGSGIWRVEGEVVSNAGAAVPSAVSVRYGQQGVAGDVDGGSIALNGALVQDEVSGALRVPFAQNLTFPEPGPAPDYVQLALNGGPGGAQESLYFVLGNGSATLRVLLVGREDAELVRALTALGDVELTAAAALPSTDGEFDLVVVNDVVVSRAPRTNVLWIGRARVQGEPEPGPLTAGYVTSWRTDHPVSRHVDWASLRTPRFYPFEPVPGTAVLAAAEDLPLVTARTTGAGRELRLAIDPVLSGWTADPSFPMLIAGLVGWLGIEFASAPAVPCVAGLPCPLQARELSATIFGPDGEVAFASRYGGLELLPDGAESGFVPATAGLYEVERAGGNRLLAVHPGFDAQASGSAADLQPPASWYAAGRYWWWIVCAAAALLLVEAWIAGRGGERFLVSRALRRGAPHAARRYALLTLRVLALAFLAAALWSAPLPVRQPQQATVTVMGADLLASDRNDAQRDVLGSLHGGGAGLVVAGTHSRIARDVGQFGSAAWNGALAQAEPGTDIEAALRLAMALLPADRPGRIVLATDGIETLGNMGRTLGSLAVRDVTLDVLPLSGASAGDLALTRVDVPRRVRLGDSYPLNAFVYSEQHTAATITILRNGAAVARQDVQLNAGISRIEAGLRAEQVGSALIEVRVDAAGDPRPENNRNGAIVDVEAAPRVLVVAQDLEWGTYFAQALSTQGLTSDVVAPVNTPRFLDGWLEYDLIVLMNMPALGLTFAQQEQLEQAVAAHGRGLLILGGERSFGPGGYYETPLENLSPLSARLPHESPRAALIFVLDRSGSMSMPVQGATRMDIAKAATLNAVSLLNEESQLGIIVFDDQPHVLVPLQEKNEAVVADALQFLSAIGGTRLYSALELALGQLEAAEEEVKHIVVMTDGIIEHDRDFTPLLVRAEAAGITVSTVAIRNAMMIDQLEFIARRGGGAYHTTSDFRALPSILAQEALTLASSPVVQQSTPVFWVDDEHAFLADLPAQLPPLASYVRTTPKPDAHLHLAAFDGDGELVPVLSSWRYGSGRVLAFASHGAGSGTQDWLSLPQYAAIWAQIVRHFLPGQLESGLHVELDRRGDRVDINARLIDDFGAPLRGRTVTAVLEGRDGEIRLLETEPGRYRGQVEISTPGTYQVVATAAYWPAPDADAWTAQARIHIGYPARLDVSQADLGAFMAMSSVTGGMLLEDASVLAQAGTVWALRSQWQPWLLLALAVFLADLLLRYGSGLLGFSRRRP